ncbi:MAG: DUF362 domain-containing protein [Candidatus Bathyarchaeota archaeon]|nr:DUF362 domain-containing protein [Candidatus Bathyarchaeota archaeon]
MPKVVVVQGEDPFQMVEKGLKFFGRPARRRIVIKPNLISAEEPPTTTPCDVVEALVAYYVKDGFDVVVAEGSGWSETFQAYRKLGYFKLAEKYKVKLVDLNNDNFNVVRSPNAFFLKEFEYPLTLKDAYIVSTPVLKEHSITKVTLSLKNMLGATLGEKARIAKKGRFHKKLDESIVDVNLYLKPSLAVIDGRMAGLEGELAAKPKKLGIIIFSEDLVAADAVAASYLGVNPSSVRHLTLAEKAGLGVADLSKIEVLKIK